MQAQQFNLKYMVIGITAILDGNGGLQIRMGMRRLETNLAAIKHIYVIDHGGQAGQELMICHETAAGKTKIFRVTANQGDPELQRLIGTLAHYRPDADLRGRSMKEAHRVMGATNMTALVPYIMVPLITLGFVVFALPWFIHGIDSGHTQVEVASFSEGPVELESRNVLVHGGQFLVEEALQIETTNDGRTSVEWAIPIVPADWSAGDPVHLVLKTHELSMQEAASLDPEAGVEGVVRNVLWEGLADDEAAYFKNNLGLSIADDVIEVEYQADTKMELFMGLGMVGFVFVVMVVVSVVVARKQR